MKKVFLLLLAMLVMTGSCLAASGSEKTTSIQDGQTVKAVSYTHLLRTREGRATRPQGGTAMIHLKMMRHRLLRYLGITVGCLLYTSRCV